MINVHRGFLWTNHAPLSCPSPPHLGKMLIRESLSNWSLHQSKHHHIDQAAFPNTKQKTVILEKLLNVIYLFFFTGSNGSTGRIFHRIVKEKVTPVLLSFYIGHLLDVLTHTHSSSRDKRGVLDELDIRIKQPRASLQQNWKCENA